MEMFEMFLFYIDITYGPFYIHLIYFAPNKMNVPFMESLL
jgi:hypothetical protein